MTGIEQLRKLGADAVRGGEVGRAICDIADQIERETEEQSARLYDERVGEETDVCELFGVVPVDDPLTSLRRHVEGLRDTIENLRLELGEARDEAAWVREHGGLDHVEAEWHSRVPHDLYERRRQRLLGHIAECETALGRRNERIAELEGRVKALTTENAELRRRAMPEGMEWPRYEDGARLAFEDELPDFARTIYKTVKTVKFQADGTAALTNGGGSANVVVIVRPGERVKRPEEVLAGDGEPLEVGQTVWNVNDGREYKVVTVESPVQFDTTSIKVDDGKAACGVWIRPDNLTHQRPVLGADGVPICEGDTVYGTVEGGPFIVTEVSDKGSVFVDAFPDTGMHGSMLTHTKPEPPDSLERIADEIDRLREEVALHLGDYLYDEDGNDSIQFSMELVAKRCRALAERERGEA